MQTSGNWNNVVGINSSYDEANLINSEGDTSGISMNISSGRFAGTTNYNGTVDAAASMFAPFSSCLCDYGWHLFEFRNDRHPGICWLGYQPDLQFNNCYINGMQIEVVPEPSAAAALLGLCAISVTCLRRRRA
jgi:hypothetical protein